MRIGIDVGGTNTDAVLMDGLQVLGKIKTPTTADVTGGITTALGRLLGDTGLEPTRVTALMIGTTHFTNAIVERRRLQPVAALRLGLPATAALPPMVDWPHDLRESIGHTWRLLHGGNEFDGRVLTPFDEQEVRQAAREVAQRGITAIAITSVFSPVTSACEEQAAAVVAEEIPGAAITLSNEIGRIGLLERENATIMNACLHDLAQRTIEAFEEAARQMGISAPLYLTQNDGTLMSAAYARKFPVLTFASGPTNSMRGAAFLSGVKDGIVVDIGGTTSDVGALVHGFPREASVAVQVGGVRTNFRMPDVYSFGLGGGSLIAGMESDDSLAVGPQSVGYELTQRALVFGGDTLTATDVAVAADLAAIGDPSRVRDLDRSQVRRVTERIQTMVEQAVDQTKTSAANVPVVLVGGGSILVGRPVVGSSEMLTPEHYAAANAIGAAIAQVSGEIDRVFSLERRSRDDAMEEAKAEAVARAIAAGAAPETVAIVDAEDVPLSYLPSNATRIRIKAVGDLAISEERVSGLGSRVSEP
ncbi:MAG: hydantoinase/oxoprolinase N-terminal domain-containing protein [Dehalococcoidia bacterium]